MGAILWLTQSYDLVDGLKNLFFEASAAYRALKINIFHQVKNYDGVFTLYSRVKKIMDLEYPSK